AAIRAGHRVTLITAPTSLRPPKAATVVPVVTSDEMFKAVKANFDKCDTLIMAAAVSDYKPASHSKTKIKKEQTVLSLNLKPTTDILKWAGRNKTKRQTLVGFALEDTNLLDNAEKKLKTKKLDMIIANEPAAISSDRSTLHIKTKTTDWQTLQNQTKTASATAILKKLETPIFNQ
ncbi:MAG: phosphopantothenoylcysteine decarboxylase domain-containing protein, partial [Planctomycetota bacterium]